MPLVKHLSLIVEAIACVPAGYHKELAAYVAKHGISGDELKSMLDRGCYDQGAVSVAMQRDPNTEAVEAAAKKKVDAQKKKAAAKKKSAAKK